VVLNLAAEPGETAGFSAERHLHVLAQHAPDFRVQEIVVDADRVPSDRERQQLQRTATLLNADVRFADVARPGTSLHDPAKLAAVLDSVRARASAVPSMPTVSTQAVGSPEGPSVNAPGGDDPWR
jgi:hypothetical protein